ncbi:MAG: 2TM domain-containing protein [Actinobacteria bacterium]|nr:2TM domain-containing protein [Actinomycetota bacterium]
MAVEQEAGREGLPGSDREDELRKEAVARLRKRSELGAHLMAYVLVNAVLVAVWAMTGPTLFWPAFPMLGWGIGLFFHAWDVFRRAPSEERIRREMHRLA